MDRIEKTLFGLALATAAGPAAASDFRGVFSLFIACPYLVAAAFTAGFILLRRRTATTQGPARYVPLALLVPAWVLLAWLCVFASVYVIAAAVMVTLAVLLLARTIWRHPHGRSSVWLPRTLMAISVATAGLMAWDMHSLMGDGMEPGDGGALLLMGLLFVFSFGLCLFAARPRKASGRPTAA